MFLRTHLCTTIKSIAERSPNFDLSMNRKLNEFQKFLSFADSSTIYLKSTDSKSGLYSSLLYVKYFSNLREVVYSQKDTLLPSNRMSSESVICHVLLKDTEN